MICERHRRIYGEPCQACAMEEECELEAEDEQMTPSSFAFKEHYTDTFGIKNPAIGWRASQMILCPFSREPCLIESCELFINYNGEGGCVFRFLLGTTCLKNSP